MINDKGRRIMEVRKLFAATTLVALSISTANAALVGRLAATEGGADYQAYYDTEADLTWLANAGATGRLSPGNAALWATRLNVDGVTGWRLPDTLQPDASCDRKSSDGDDFGYNCTGSEMGNLYYNVLGGSALISLATSHNANYDLFSNIQSGFYWSGDYERLSYNEWVFRMDNGNQSYTNDSNYHYAWAVHDGDVSAVPIPPAVFLFSTGLLGLISFTKRKAS